MVLVGEQGNEVGRLLCVHVCKRDLAAHVKKSVKYIQVDILFKTKSIELPNQNKKGNKWVPVIQN